MARSRRNYKGRYARRWQYHFSPLFWLAVGILFLAFIWLYFQKHEEQELLSPCEDGCSFFMVRAVEPEIVQEPKTIYQLVDEIFKDDSKTAKEIMFCESRDNPDTVGDTHIMSINQETGEVVGDSIGLFQIRTGSHNWNRAKRNGMTADEFREWLRVPENNIKYAREIHLRRGWEAWHNCAVKVGAYERN